MIPGVARFFLDSRTFVMYMYVNGHKGFSLLDMSLILDTTQLSMPHMVQHNSVQRLWHRLNINTIILIFMPKVERTEGLKQVRYIIIIVMMIIIIFIPSVSRIPRDLETEKLEIENVRSDT